MKKQAIKAIFRSLTSKTLNWPIFIEILNRKQQFDNSKNADIELY